MKKCILRSRNILKNRENSENEGKDCFKNNFDQNLQKNYRNRDFEDNIFDQRKDNVDSLFHNSLKKNERLIKDHLNDKENLIKFLKNSLEEDKKDILTHFQEILTSKI